MNQELKEEFSEKYITGGEICRLMDISKQYLSLTLSRIDINSYFSLLEKCNIYAKNHPDTIRLMRELGRKG